jgi:hypothetical protein
VTAVKSGWRGYGARGPWELTFNRIFPILRFFDIAKADEFAPSTLKD